MASEILKLETELEACCICSASDEELYSPEEHDAGAAPGQPPLRAMLMQLNNNKVVPNGRLCSNCIRRTLDAYSFSTTLASKGPPPLSEKIRALRKRLHELTQKIDVFIVVGGGGANGAYSEEDIIMVERGALAAATRADAAEAVRAPDARGDHVYQCTMCPLTFHRMSEYRAHTALHAADSVHSCWSCGAQCASRAALDLHAQGHVPPSPLHCHLCNTTFQSSLEQRRHEASCPSVCVVGSCAAVLGSRAALREHTRALHASVCAECFVTCASPAERAAHALHHRQDKHFVCGYKACILRFHTRSNLMAHIRKCHGGDESPAEESPAPLAAPAAPAAAPAAPVPCAHCPRTFGSTSAMKRHARTHRGKDTDAQDMEWREDGDKVEYLEVETLEELDEQDTQSHI